MLLKCLNKNVSKYKLTTQSYPLFPTFCRFNATLEAKKTDLQFFLAQLSKKYNLNSVTDWNSLSSKIIRLEGGGKFLNNFTLYDIKCLGYPDGAKIYKKPVKPPGYWDDSRNVDDFIEILRQKYKLNTMEDWDKLKKKQIQESGGISLFSKYTLHEIKIKGNPEIQKNQQQMKKPNFYWNNIENVKKFLNDLNNKFDFSSNNWESLTEQKILSQYGGSSILSKYTLLELIKIANPQINENLINLPQKIKKKPKGYWENGNNVREYLLNLKTKLNLKSADELTWEKIKLNNGSSLLYKYSLEDLRCILDTNYKKLSNKSLKPMGYWNNRENVLNFIDYLSIQLNLKTKEDWNKVTKKQIQNLGGRTLFSTFSLLDIKIMGCPDLNYSKNLLNFPSSYWNSTNEIINFLEFLRVQYQYSDSDLNFLTEKLIIDYGGKFLLKKYSLAKLKSFLSPNNKETKKNFTQNETLEHDVHKIQDFIDFLRVKYELNTLHDWKNLTKSQIKAVGGSFLFSRLSLLEIQCLGSPELKLQLKSIKPKGFWDKHENIQKFFKEQLQSKLQLHSKEDWYRISEKQIRLFGGGYLLNKYSMFDLINIAFPNENWSKDKMETKRKRSEQRFLFLQMQKIFQGEEIIEDYFHEELTRISGSAVQFDIFIPKRKIAIEYHGKQHYEDIPSGFGTLEMYQRRDEEKRELCLTHNICLLVIPHWLDSSVDSLTQFVNENLKI